MDSMRGIKRKHYNTNAVGEHTREVETTVESRREVETNVASLRVDERSKLQLRVDGRSDKVDLG